MGQRELHPNQEDQGGTGARRVGHMTPQSHCRGGCFHTRDGLLWSESFVGNVGSSLVQFPFTIAQGTNKSHVWDGGVVSRQGLLILWVLSRRVRISSF